MSIKTKQDFTHACMHALLTEVIHFTIEFIFLLILMTKF